LLLATFLKECGFGPFRYIRGRRGEGAEAYTHAWLEQPGILVDLTADQFSDMTRSVIVASSSAWHDTFEREDAHEADFQMYDAVTVSELERAYRAIINTWKAS
jgi:hypothetical protein